MPAMTVPEPGATPEPTASRPPEPLPARTAAAVAIVVALLTVAALVALLWWVSLTGLTGADLTNARLSAIRIGPPDNGKILNREGIWGTVFDTTA